MPKYVLNYFNGRGRAEISRLICAAADITYTDSRIKDFSEWPAKKPEAPTGQMPYLEVDDLKIPQSMSIARYLAREAGLAGKTSLEQAQADAIVDTVLDALNDFVKKVFTIKDEKEKAEALTKFLAEDLPKHAGNVEKLIGFYGKNGSAVGDALTWADLYVFDYFSGYTEKVPDFKTNYPKISHIVEAVKQHPKIAEYIKNRPVTEF